MRIPGVSRDGIHAGYPLCVLALMVVVYPPVWPASLIGISLTLFEMSLRWLVGR